MRKFVFLAFAGSLLMVGAGCTSAATVNVEPPRQVACTMEAKECPDGSYVGRVGPNCEFAPCPKTPGPMPAPEPEPMPAPVPPPRY